MPHPPRTSFQWRLVGYLSHAPLTWIVLAVLLGNVKHETQFVMAPKLFVSGTVTSVDWARRKSYWVTVRLTEGQVVRLDNRYRGRHPPREGQTLALRCTRQVECRGASWRESYGEQMWLLLLLLTLGAFNVFVPWFLWRAWKAERSR